MEGRRPKSAAELQREREQEKVRRRKNAEALQREKEHIRALRERPQYDTPLRQSDSDNDRPYHWSLHNQHDTAPAYVPPQEMTRATYKRLSQQRDDLKRKIRAAAGVVRDANSDGNHLRDNSSFRAAEEERGQIEAEIIRIETILQHATIVLDGMAKGKGIEVGTRARVRLSGKEQTYTIVRPHDSSPRNGRLSCESPVGRALIGHRTGDQFDITTPEGVIRAVILSIDNS